MVIIQYTLWVHVSVDETIRSVWRVWKMLYKVLKCESVFWFSKKRNGNWSLCLSLHLQLISLKGLETGSAFIRITRLFLYMPSAERLTPPHTVLHTWTHTWTHTRKQARTHTLALVGQLTKCTCTSKHICIQL